MEGGEGVGVADCYGHSGVLLANLCGKKHGYA